jgi:threonine dehydratase
MRLPTFADIVDARARIAPHAHTTPLLEWSFLNERTGGRILAKVEALQRTGSFKFRGAYNHISRLSKTEFPGGVVACSSGNHAQGVAAAAKLCGLAAAIVMPEDAPATKIERTRGHGASPLSTTPT